jgi:alpha-D-ribose 1-methylphosphonate 5-triphosphate synthase subunit PhnG
MRTVIDPLAAAQAESATTEARKAAATRVQFFTLATMR